jgi:hypothetical protein
LFVGQLSQPAAEGFDFFLQATICEQQAHGGLWYNQEDYEPQEGDVEPRVVDKQLHL